MITAAAVPVPDDDGGFIEAVESFDDLGRISMEVGHRSGVRSVPGRSRAVTLRPALPKTGHRPIPAPGTVPSTVDEHDRVGHITEEVRVPSGSTAGCGEAVTVGRGEI